METLTTLAEPTHSVLDSPNSPSPGSPPNDANPSSTPTPDPPSTPAAAIDLEPDEAWKGWLRFRIERSMKSVVERVRDEYESRLATLTTTSSPSGTGSKPSASQLSAARDEYDAAMADIIRLAQTHFDRALERERQERRWAAGAEVDAEWQAQMIAEHQAIADLIEREKRQLTQQKEHRGGSGTGRGQSQYQTIAGQQPPPRLLAIRPPEAVPWFRGDNVSSVSSDGSSSSGSYGGTRRRPRQFPNDFGPGRHLNGRSPSWPRQPPAPVSSTGRPRDAGIESRQSYSNADRRQQSAGSKAGSHRSFDGPVPARHPSTGVHSSRPDPHSRPHGHGPRPNGSVERSQRTWPASKARNESATPRPEKTPELDALPTQRQKTLMSAGRGARATLPLPVSQLRRKVDDANQRAEGTGEQEEKVGKPSEVKQTPFPTSSVTSATLKRLEAVLEQKLEEVKTKDEEITRRELIVQRREDEVKRKEQVIRNKEDEIKQKEEAIRRKELELELREVDSSPKARINQLDELLDITSRTDPNYRRLVRDLSRLCGQEGILPASYRIDNIVQKGTGAYSCGGYADVWRGLYNGDLVALKIMRLHVADRKKCVLDFCREAVFWKQLAHPNIVPFLGVSQSHNLCIVSEWMAFGDVITYLQKFPRANRRQLVTDVACGLEYMHASAMIHGDIKGRNILVDGSRRARLGDFGLARTVLGPKSFTPSISRSGGTMRYMAPELAENSNPGQPTRETDVYAFAMASWEIFCGEQIFPHLPEWTVFARVLSGERPLRPKGAYDLGLDDGTWALLEACWDNDPSERPSISRVIGVLTTPDSTK